MRLLLKLALFPVLILFVAAARQDSVSVREEKMSIPTWEIGPPTRIDAYLAASDLLEAMALTPWCISLNKAVSVASSNSVRSASVIASHFERFGHGEVTKDRTNQGIADHLQAFARQFSADPQPG